MSSPPLLQLKYAFLNSWQSEPLSFICARQSFTVDPLLTQSDPLMQSISVSAISLQDAPILALILWLLAHLNLLFAQSVLPFIVKDKIFVRSTVFRCASRPVAEDDEVMKVEVWRSEGGMLWRVLNLFWIPKINSLGNRFFQILRISGFLFEMF